MIGHTRTTARSLVWVLPWLSALTACVPTVLDYGSDACGASAAGCFKFTTERAFVTAGQSLTLGLPGAADDYTFEVVPDGAVSRVGNVVTATGEPGLVTVTAKERKKPTRLSRLSFTIVAAASAPTLVVDKTKVTTGRTYQIAVAEAVAGNTYEWSANNARLVSSPNGTQVQFEAGGIGIASLSVIARNAAGDAAAPVFATLQVVERIDGELEIIAPRKVTEQRVGLVARVSEPHPGATYHWDLVQNGASLLSQEQGSELVFDAASPGTMQLSVRAVNAAEEASETLTTINIDVVPRGLELVLGSLGASGNADGPGAEARFQFPTAMVALSNGHALIADADNYTIREFVPAVGVKTVLGKAGAYRESPAQGDGVGDLARLDYVVGIARLDDNHAFILETNSSPEECTVRSLTRSGDVWAATTIWREPCTDSADLMEYPTAIAVDLSTTPATLVIVSQSGYGSAEVFRMTQDGSSLVRIAGDRNESPGADDGGDDNSGLDATFDELVSVSYYAGTSELDQRRGLYLVDSLGADDTQRVRHIRTDGDVETTVLINQVLGEEPESYPVDAEWVNDQLVVAWNTRLARFEPSPEALIRIVGPAFDDSSSSLGSFFDAFQTPAAGFVGMADISPYAGGLYLLDSVGELRHLQSANVAAGAGAVASLAGRGWTSDGATKEAIPSNSRLLSLSRPLLERDRLIFGMSTASDDFRHVGQIRSYAGGPLQWLAGDIFHDAMAQSVPIALYSSWNPRHVLSVDRVQNDQYVLALDNNPFPTNLRVWRMSDAGIAITTTMVPNSVAATINDDGWVYSIQGDYSSSNTLTLSIGDQNVEVIDFNQTALGTWAAKSVALLDAGRVLTGHFQQGYFGGAIVRTTTATGDAQVVVGLGPNCSDDFPSNINHNTPCLEACVSTPNGMAVANNGDVFVADMQAIQRIRRIDTPDCRIDTITADSLEQGVRVGSSPRFNNAQHIRISEGGDLYVTDSEEVGLYLLRY